MDPPLMRHRVSRMLRVRACMAHLRSPPVQSLASPAGWVGPCCTMLVLQAAILPVVDALARVVHRTTET